MLAGDLLLHTSYLAYSHGCQQDFSQRVIEGNLLTNLRQDPFSSPRRSLQLNGLTQGFIDSVVNSKASSHPSKEEESLGSVYVPYVKAVSEKFEHVRD
jgi:hypothetical protein